MTAIERLRDLWGLWGVEKTEEGHMSMISSQCDKLRAAAQACRSLGRHEMEQTLLDAADLISELRDDLQRANDAVQDAEHDESMAWDRVRKAEAESEKLRELCCDMWLHSYCSIAKTREDDERHVEDVIDRMRELGIEVD